MVIIVDDVETKVPVSGPKDLSPSGPVTIDGKKAKQHIEMVDANDPTIQNLSSAFDDAKDEPMTGKGLRLNKLIGRGFRL